MGVNSKLLTDIDIQSLRKLAKESKWPKKNEQSLGYIERVLMNSKFQENPQAFIKSWKERRGSTEEFRYGEDSALQFFGLGKVEKIWHKTPYER
jgi:hypothetical protein